MISDFKSLISALIYISGCYNWCTDGGGESGNVRWGDSGGHVTCRFSQRAPLSSSPSGFFSRIWRQLDQCCGCSKVSLGVAKVVNVTPRYARLQADANGSGLGQIIGWQNIELISDRPLETMLQKILTAIRREELIDRVEQTGIDAIEITFHVPMVCQSVKWVRQLVKTLNYWEKFVNISMQKPQVQFGQR
ncbi:hypothetical protein ACET3Z_011616 [Daucus carota]